MFSLSKSKKENCGSHKKSLVTIGIFKSIFKKNKLYKNVLKKPCYRNETAYKKYKNKLNHVIKTEKKAYYETQFLKYKNDIKKTWQTINEVLNRNKTRSKLPDTFLQKNSNNNVSNPLEIANKFNEYFVKIGPQLAKKIPKNDNITYESYLNGNYV
jgi:hypothetical protein